MMEPKEKLSEALERVHSQRMALEDWKQAVVKIEDRMSLSQDGIKLARLITAKADAATALNTAMTEAKQLAQDVAVELNDKKPHPGVLVKAKTTITITDKEAALEYVKTVYPTLVSYNEKAFMKILKALPDEVLPRWVSRTTDDYATPTIVKDLGKFFGAEEAPF